MKKALLICTLAFVSLLILNSCKKEEKDPRDDYVGTFSVTESWTSVLGGSGTDSYSLSIAKSSVDEEKIIINNLGDLFNGISAIVNGSNFTITSQLTSYNGYSWRISGSGTLTGTYISINYTGAIEETGVTGGYTASASGSKE